MEDEDRRRRFGAAALERPTRYRIEAIGARWEALFGELAAGRGALRATAWRCHSSRSGVSTSFHGFGASAQCRRPGPRSGVRVGTTAHRSGTSRPVRARQEVQDLDVVEPEASGQLQALVHDPCRRSRPRSRTSAATLKASKSNPCRASAARRSSAAAAGRSRSRFAAVLMTPKPLIWRSRGESELRAHADRAPGRRAREVGGDDRRRRQHHDPLDVGISRAGAARPSLRPRLPRAGERDRVDRHLREGRRDAVDGAVRGVSAHRRTGLTWAASESSSGGAAARGGCGATRRSPPAPAAVRGPARIGLVGADGGGRAATSPPGAFERHVDALLLGGGDVAAVSSRHRA